MRGKLRVKLDPTPRPVTEGAVVTVRQVTVSLSRFGPGTSEGVRDEVRPATLKLRARAFEKARAPAVSTTDLGSVEGTLAFRADGVPEFLLETSALAEPVAPSAEASSQKRPRFVDLFFNPAQFGGPLLGDPVPLRAFLDVAPEGNAAHFELDVELRVDGAIEAAFEANDTLDVPDQPTPRGSSEAGGRHRRAHRGGDGRVRPRRGGAGHVGHGQFAPCPSVA